MGCSPWGCKEKDTTERLTLLTGQLSASVFVGIGSLKKSPFMYTFFFFNLNTWHVGS